MARPDLGLRRASHRCAVRHVRRVGGTPVRREQALCALEDASSAEFHLTDRRAAEPSDDGEPAKTPNTRLEIGTTARCRLRYRLGSRSITDASNQTGIARYLRLYKRNFTLARSIGSCSDQSSRYAMALPCIRNGYTIEGNITSAAVVVSRNGRERQETSSEAVHRHPNSVIGIRDEYTPPERSRHRFRCTVSIDQCYGANRTGTTPQRIRRGGPQ